METQNIMDRQKIRSLNNIVSGNVNNHNNQYSKVILVLYYIYWPKLIAYHIQICPTTDRNLTLVA